MFEFLEAHPEIVAVAMLGAGVVFGQLLRRLVGRGLAATDAWMSRNSTSDVTLITPALIASAKSFVFWVVVALSVVLALRAMGVDVFAGALSQAVVFVPRLVIALAIIGVGHLLGLLAQVLVARMSESIEPDSLAPRVAHGVIVVVAVVIGFQQLGIDLTFVTQLVLAVLVLGLGGLVLAFALGARDHVANLLGRSELNRFAVGERVRIDGAEGTIIEIHATGVELATADGVLSVPAARFARAAVLKVPDTDEAESG